MLPFLPFPHSPRSIRTISQISYVHLNPLISSMHAFRELCFSTYSEPDVINNFLEVSFGPTISSPFFPYCLHVVTEASKRSKNGSFFFPIRGPKFFPPPWNSSPGFSLVFLFPCPVSSTYRRCGSPARTSKTNPRAPPPSPSDTAPYPFKAPFFALTPSSLPRSPLIMNPP